MDSEHVIVDKKDLEVVLLHLRDKFGQNFIINTDERQIKKPKPVKRPPLGLMPERVYKHQRFIDIRLAIKRYEAEDKEIPDSWIREHNKLLKYLKKNLKNPDNLQDVNNIQKIKRKKKPKKCIKKLIPSVKEVRDENGNRDIDEVFFDLALMINKDNELTIYNGIQDGDWREDVDANTLIVKEVKINIH